MPDDDPVARLRAEMDQAREGIKEFARTLYAFHAESREAGFTPSEAFTLTREYLALFIAGTRGGGDDE